MHRDTRMCVCVCMCVCVYVCVYVCMCVYAQQPPTLRVLDVLAGDRGGGQGHGAGKLEADGFGTVRRAIIICMQEAVARIEPHFQDRLLARVRGERVGGPVQHVEGSVVEQVGGGLVPGVAVQGDPSPYTRTR